MRILPCVLLIALLSALPVSAGYLVALDQSASGVFSAGVLWDSVIVAMGNRVVAINLTNAEVSELLLNTNISYLKQLRHGLAGLGSSNNLATVALFEDISSIVVLKLGPQVTLYDVADVHTSILGTGYLAANGTYWLFLANLSYPLLYTTNCQSACYGKRLIHTGPDVFVVGSVYRRSSLYGWSYDVFIGKLLDGGYVVGKYVEMEGNDYVADAYSIGGLLYVVVNSDVGGTYLAFVSPITYNATLYRIVVDGSSVACRSTILLSNRLLMLVEGLSSGSRYLVLIDTASLRTNAYVIGQDVAAVASAGRGLVVTILRGASFANTLSITNLSEFDMLMMGRGGVHVHLSAVSTKVQDLRLALTAYNVPYNIVRENVSMRRLGTATRSSLEAPMGTVVTPREGPYSRPLYEPRGGDPSWDYGLQFLAAGMVLVTTSIILKYMARRKDRS